MVKGVAAGTAGAKGLGKGTAVIEGGGAWVLLGSMVGTGTV